MNIINLLRKNFIYFFVSLPFVIILYELIMMLAVNNRAYLILTLGQILFVPALFVGLSFVHNNFLNNFAGVILLFGLSVATIVLLSIYGNNLPAK
jgi:hypothetical protein